MTRPHPRYRAMGGIGCISVTANVAPALCAMLHRAWDSGDLDRFAALRDLLDPLHAVLFRESNPIPVKAALASLGLCSDEVRLPLTRATLATQERLLAVMPQVMLAEEHAAQQPVLRACRLAWRYRLMGNTLLAIVTRGREPEDNIVFDLLMLTLLAVAFAGAVAYVWACVDLTRGDLLGQDAVTWQGWLQIAVFAALITAVVKPLGGYIARSVDGSGRVQRALAPIENGLYRLAGVDPAEEQSWVTYALALLWFHLAGIVALYVLQRVQNLLPLNPQQFDAVAPDLALNTAVSFATNTSWQSYGGETTLSYLSQMAGITVQSFLSGATGVAVAIALVRGFARRSARTIGNFWVDVTRITLYVLLPICVVAGLFLVWQGVPQTLGAYVSATTLEGANQVLARGPVASQEAIKLLSGDGGGFFNANSAHPFENPTALTGRRSRCC